MKKVLLIGELNQTLSNVNKCLVTQFQTQVCMDTLDLVKGMAKIFEPDFVIISLVGINELDKKILTFLESQYSKVPILLLGTEEECKCYEKYYENPQIKFLIRPITNPILLEKIMKMLHLTKQKEELEVLTKQEEKKHILVVDDNGVLLRSVKAILEKKYTISVATSGKMGLKQAKRKLPDLILLDYEMPEWDGKKTLEEIRADEKLKDIPVVFLTGVKDRNHIAAVLSLNIAAYLLKPIEQQKLLDVMEKLLG